MILNHHSRRAHLDGGDVALELERREGLNEVRVLYVDLVLRRADLPGGYWDGKCVDEGEA